MALVGVEKKVEKKKEDSDDDHFFDELNQDSGPDSGPGSDSESESEDDFSVAKVFVPQQQAKTMAVPQKPNSPRDFVLANGNLSTGKDSQTFLSQEHITSFTGKAPSLSRRPKEAK